MVKIKNPIIPGMAPDPSIIRVENTYYLATSRFIGCQAFNCINLQT